MHERNSELISGRNLDVGRFFMISFFFGRYNILIELHFSHSDTLVLFEEFQASDFLYTLRLERHEVLQVRGLPPECRKPKRCGQ
jgi:hypothetical protein